MTAGSPVNSILGVANPANPFDVLGLEVGVVSDADIVDALGRRMKQVADHAMSETPEGNEVRLALHAAAAQLLDPRVRQALYERAGVHTPARTPATPKPASVLGPHAMMVIASEGGWNIRALRRLAMIAHAEGIPSSAIPHAIRGIVGESRPADEPRSDQERRGQRPQSASASTSGDALGTWVTGGVVIAAIAVLGVTWGVLQSSFDRPAPEQVEAAPPVGTTVPPVRDEELGRVAEQAPPDTVESASPIIEDEPDWAAALIGIRDARESVDAATALVVLDGLAGSWTEADDRALDRISAAFVDVVYAMSPDEAAMLVAEMASATRGRRADTAGLFAGLLNRLSVERSLPTAVDNAVVAALVSTIGARQRSPGDPFSAGAAAGLRFVASDWSNAPPETDAIDRWLAAADAVARIDAPVAAAAIRWALSNMLREGPDPLGDPRMLRAVGRLAERLSPESNADDAGMVLALLGDPQVSTRAVSSVMNVIARGQGTLPGGDSVRLAPTASASERAELRERLAGTWVGGAPNADESDAVVEAVLAHLRAGKGVSPVEHLADAVVSARLVNAARLSLWGSAEQAARRVDGIRTDIDRLIQQSGGTKPALSGSSERWAVRYLEAERNIPVRLSLLSELTQQPRELGAVAAEVLVAEAVNGSPAQVRRDAQSIVIRSADQTSVINAALEILPTAPRVRSVQMLMEAVARRPLPDIRDDAWMFEARRAIVDRLLTELSGTGEGAKIDGLAILMVDEYADQLGRGGSAAEEAAALAEELLEEHLADIRRVDLAGTAAPRVAELERLLAGRRSMADGGATMFAAAQATATELLAELIRLEAPQRTAEIDAVLRDLTAERAAAGTVFEQMSVTERARLRLWAMRIGVGP